MMTRKQQYKLNDTLEEAYAAVDRALKVCHSASLRESLTRTLALIDRTLDELEDAESE
jgi:hypothetical protein